MRAYLVARDRSEMEGWKTRIVQKKRTLLAGCVGKEKQPDRQG